MNEKNEQLYDDIAASLDVPVRLMDCIPELLADIWALGSSPTAILEMLQEHEFSGESSVYDVGCGKGAVGIALAKRFGCQVTGVDAYAPFLEEARKKARLVGVSDLCTFEEGDIRDVLTRKETYDLVVFCAIDGGWFGSLKDCVKGLRQLVRAGGYIVIDGGFAAEETNIEHIGYHYCAPYETTLHQLTAFGDRILCEELFSSEEMGKLNQHYTSFIQRRADALIAKYPDKECLLREFVHRKNDETKILETSITGGLWLIEKTSE